jgi:hypothetical protein
LGEHFALSAFSYPEDGGRTLFQNVGKKRAIFIGIAMRTSYLTGMDFLAKTLNSSRGVLMLY